jgi:hypothetical protein
MSEYVFGVCLSLAPYALIYYNIPHVLPTRRGKAARQLDALQAWSLSCPVKVQCCRAEGAFLAQDYENVDSAFREASQIVYR